MRFFMSAVASFAGAKKAMKMIAITVGVNAKREKKNEVPSMGSGNDISVH